MATLLAACSSGSGGNDTPATQGPTAEDLANADASNVVFLLKTHSNELEVKWVDRFAAEQGYRVERRSDAGIWEVQESLPPTPGTGTQYTWQRVIDKSATYRVVAQRDPYVVPLSAEGTSAMTVDLMQRQMALLVDQSGPLRGVVQLSVEGAVPARSVHYFVDLASLSESTTSPSFATSWDTRTVPDGAHLLLAQVKRAPGVQFELRRSVSVDNPNVAVSLVVNGTSGIITLAAIATSDVGVRSVEFFLNGSSIAVSTSPTHGNEWVHVLDTQGMAAAPAIIRVVATDNAGEQAAASRQVAIDNFPVLTLETPTNGAIASTSLQIRGTVVDDLPGTVTSVFLGDVQIFETSQPSFDRSYSLAGLPNGPYTLTVRLRDAAGNTRVTRRAVIVSAASAFNHEVIGSYADHTSLLDTAVGKLLYQLPDGTVRLRRADGTVVEMAGSASIEGLQFVDRRVGGLWQMSGNYITASGRIGSDPATTFVFDSSGERTDIHYAFGAGEFDDFLRSGVHGDWLVWGENHIYLRNLATQGPTQGPLDGRMLKGHAFVDTPGQERLFFSRETGQQGASTTIDLFGYSPASGTTMQLSGSDGRHFRPQTDGLRVAWEKAQHNANVHEPPFELIVAPVNNPTAALSRSSTMTAFDLEDGWLAWVEIQSNTPTLKVDDGIETTTLSSTASTALYSNSGGHVIFGENGKLYTWDKMHGRRTLLDTLPTEIVHEDGIVYFSLGLSDPTAAPSGMTIYRTML